MVQSGSEWQARITAESTALERFGLKVKICQADGACLFRSFSDQYHGNESRHAEVRKKCVDFMRAHPDGFSPFVDEDEAGRGGFEGYLQRMSEPSTWGGDIEIQALSQCFEVNVVLHLPSHYPDVVAELQKKR